MVSLLPLPPLTPFYSRGNPSSKWVSHFAKISKELQSWVFSNPRLTLPAPSLDVSVSGLLWCRPAAAAARLEKGEPHVQLFVAKTPKNEREREQGKYSEDQLLLLTRKDPFFGFDL